MSPKLLIFTTTHSIECVLAAYEAFRRVPAISPGFSDASSLTIDRDADDNPKGALQNVRDALKYAAFFTGIVANYMKTRYKFEAPVKRNVKRDKSGYFQ